MIADCLISFLTELVLMQECKGVDLNRNFGYHWGGYGASDNPCKETFRGSSAFSAPASPPKPRACFATANSMFFLSAASSSPLGVTHLPAVT